MNLSPRFVAGALVLSLSIAGTGLHLAAAAAGKAGAAKTEIKLALPMAGKLMVAGAATINGKKALSGTTIFSETRLAIADTPGNTATIMLGKLGRLDLQPGTELVLRFGDGLIGGELLAGQAIIKNNAGVKVAVKTPFGLAAADGQDTAPTVATAQELTAEEMVKQAETFLKKGKTVAEQANKQLDESRRAKDIMKANCLNRKLTELNAITRNIEQRQKALTAAINAKDEAGAKHEFTVLSVLSQKIGQLQAEVSQCSGEQSEFKGETKMETPVVETEVPTEIPTNPPTIPEPPAPQLDPVDTKQVGNSGSGSGGTGVSGTGGVAGVAGTAAVVTAGVVSNKNDKNEQNLINFVTQR